MVFASSGHAIGFYPKSQTIPADVTVRPDSRYGLSKAFGEAVGQPLRPQVRGRRCCRSASARSPPSRRARPAAAIWVSPRDLCQLIRIGLERPGIRHEIVYGVSANTGCWWDNANAARLGYKPQDGAGEPESGPPGDEATGDPRVDLNQGGVFCAMEEITERL